MIVAEERAQQAQTLAKVDGVQYMERETLHKDKDVLNAQLN